MRVFLTSNASPANWRWSLNCIRDMSIKAPVFYVFRLTSLPDIFKFKYIRDWHVTHHVDSPAFRYILWAGSSNIMQTSRVYVFEIGRRCLTYLNLNMSGSDTSYIISILGRSWWFLWAGENRSSSLHAILNPVLWRPSQWSIKYLKTHISPSVFWAWISRELIHFSSEIPDNCENSVCRSLFEGLGHHTSTLFLPCPKMFFCCLQSCLPSPILPQNKTCTPESPGPWAANGTSVRRAKFSCTTDGAIPLMGFSAVAWILKFDLMYDVSQPELFKFK